MSVPGLGECNCRLCRMPRPDLKATRYPWGAIIEFEGKPPTSEEVKRVMGTDKSDPVNNPSHYTSHPSGVECIEITQHHDFATGNAIKYLWRCGLKTLGKSEQEATAEDLQKAYWYVDRAHLLVVGKHIETKRERDLKEEVRLLKGMVERYELALGEAGVEVSKL